LQQQITSRIIRVQIIIKKLAYYSFYAISIWIGAYGE